MRDETRGNETLAVLLTRACQFDCVYCRYSRDQPAISRALLERCVDALGECSAPELTLQFIGGEPLLRFEAMLETIRYAQKKRLRGKVFRFAVTTNGLLLDDKKLKILSRYPVRFQLSLDGPPASQAANRPMRGRKKGVYPARRLERALELLLEKGCDFAVHSVISPEKVSRMFDDAMSFMDAGVPELHYQYRVGIEWSLRDATAYCREITRIAFAAKKRGLPLEGLMDANEPAIISRSCTVDTDGEVYLGCAVPSMELILPRLKECNLLGNIRDANPERLLGHDDGVLARAQGLYPDDASLDRVVQSNIRMGWLSRRTEWHLRRKLSGGGALPAGAAA